MRRGGQRLDSAIFVAALERIGVYENGRKNRSYDAAMEVLCNGWQIASAARGFRLSRQSIKKAISRIEATVVGLGCCACCGQPLQKG
ncbi:MAG TPA: hypothetical protein VFC18_18950 [Burkholderiales bacterium]|nr:hypothetical protein [Burkholderiales bacterium]